LRVLLIFIRLAYQQAAIYRFEFWVRIGGVFIMMYGMLSLWKTLSTQGVRLGGGIPLEQMPTYGTINIIIFSLLSAAYSIRHYVAGQVRSGKLELDLLKPVNFINFMLLRNFGEFMTGLLVTGIPGLVFAIFVLKVQLPAQPINALLFVLSLLLAYLIFFAFNLLVGMVAIVSLNISSYTWAIDALVSFASGMVVPLTLFPDKLKALLYLLPFYNLYQSPLQIYLGSAHNIYQVLAIQLLWVVVLFLCAHLAWRIMDKKVQIQGG